MNKLAEGKPFCSVTGTEVSSASDILAYAVDFVGRRLYTLKFKNLDTGEHLPDEITNVSGNVAWAEDNQDDFLYTSGSRDFALVSDLPARVGNRSGSG